MMETNKKERNIAVVAYLTFVGLLIAYYLNHNHRFPLARFHIKNMFGLVVLMLVSQVAQSYEHLAWYGELLWLILFFMWIYSLIMAFQNRKKAIPWLSDKFQVWFRFLD